MGFNYVTELVGVSTAHAGYKRDLILMGGLQYHAISLLASFARDTQLAQPVSIENINAGLIEDEIGLYLFK